MTEEELNAYIKSLAIYEGRPEAEVRAAVLRQLGRDK